jgi:hypothetical protein
MEDLKDAVADVVQKESDRGTDFSTVATMLDQQLILMIKDIRKMELGLASGGARCAPPLTNRDPEANGFALVYDTFRRQFDKAFERALEKERDFKRAFPGAPTSLRTQVIQTLRRLRKAVQSMPDQVARHKMLIASIRSYGLGLKGARSTMGREREEEGREVRGSLRLRTSGRHCQWCSWKVYTSLEEECEVCACWSNT